MLHFQHPKNRFGRINHLIDEWIITGSIGCVKCLTYSRDATPCLLCHVEPSCEIFDDFFSVWFDDNANLQPAPQVLVVR